MSLPTHFVGVSAAGCRSHRFGYLTDIPRKHFYGVTEVLDADQLDEFGEQGMINRIELDLHAEFAYEDSKTITTQVTTTANPITCL